MKIEDIKKEALRLMFATENASGNLDELEGVEDYLDKMEGSIQRCLVRVSQAKKLGLKSYRCKITSREVGETDEQFEERCRSINGIDMDSLTWGLNLADKIKDFMQIDKIFILAPNRSKIAYSEFSMLDNKTICFDSCLPNGTEVQIMYFPMFKYETNSVDELDLSDEICTIIPYFIKGELYEEDEYQLAQQAMSTFEARLNAIDVAPVTVQTNVSDVWGRY